MRSPTKSNATPRVLLRWRGVADIAEEEAAADIEPWQGNELADLGVATRNATYSVLKRLGPSEMYVGGNEDLANELRVAYDALIGASTS